jgi:glycosyltransferase involved in cell wall biosynthesis
MTLQISILIPCFNADKWIAQSIESALAQTWPNKEVVVLDDGSTDGSLDIIRRFDGRIRWETGPNRGGGAARDRLLTLAHGEWLQYLDADDLILPEKITRQVEFLERHTDCDVVCSPFPRASGSLDPPGIMAFTTNWGAAMEAYGAPARRRLANWSAMLSRARALFAPP